MRNTTAAAKDVKNYRTVDCYLADNDHGTASIYANSVSCNASNGRRIAFTDLSGDALRQETNCSQIWAVAKSDGDYDGTSLSYDHDNGMGINWSRTVPASGVITLRSRFQSD